MAVSKKEASKQPARKVGKKVATLNPEKRSEMISEEAYYLAEKRGFEGDCQLHDWLEAEARIDRIYGKAV